MRAAGRSRSCGFGLIELLIALALGLILVLGVVQVFIASKQTFLLQRTADNLHEDARYIVSRLSQELRMISMFGCLDLARLPASIRANIPVAFSDPITYTTSAGVSTLKLIAAVPNHERFVANVSRSPANYGANWLIATDCRNTSDLRISAAEALVVRPGDIVIPVRQLEYRFTNDAIQVRNNGAGNFQTLIDGVADFSISFGLAAGATDRDVSGTYVTALPAADAGRIRSVNLQWQLSDNPSAPATGTVQAQDFRQVVAIRNRID